MITIARLIWDAWNVVHIARHKVTQEEVEQVCERNPMTTKTYGGRLRVIGPTQTDKILTVILAPKENIYFPITARTASRKERRLYKQYKGGEQSDEKSKKESHS